MVRNQSCRDSVDLPEPNGTIGDRIIDRLADVGLGERHRPVMPQGT